MSHLLKLNESQLLKHKYNSPNKRSHKIFHVIQSLDTIKNM